MLQSASVSILNKILNELSIPIIKLSLLDAKGDTSRIDHSEVRAHVLDIRDRSKAITVNGYCFIIHYNAFYNTCLSTSLLFFHLLKLLGLLVLGSILMEYPFCLRMLGQKSNCLVDRSFPNRLKPV